MLLVYAGLYDFNLMGTREVFPFLKIFMFGMLLFVLFHKRSRYTMCADTEREPILCQIILTLVSVLKCSFPGSPGAGPTNIKVENFSLFYQYHTICCVPLSLEDPLTLGVNFSWRFLTCYHIAPQRGGIRLYSHQQCVNMPIFHLTDFCWSVKQNISLLF